MRLVFIDTETNDHPSKGPELRIVSITWLIARLDGTVEKIEDYIIRPDGFRIAKGAEQVHKISEAHARKHGHPIGDVLSMLVDDLQHPQGMTMVCHNVRFDRDVIGHELQRHGIPFDIFSLPSFDTMKSTASICKLPKARGSGYKDPKLQELHAHIFGKEFENAHTSKADVEATARCFFELRRRGLFGEIGRSVANQVAEQSRAQLAANTEKDTAKKIRPHSDADANVTKTSPAREAPATQHTIAMVKPIPNAEPARKVAIPPPAVAPPAKQHTGSMQKPTSNATGSIPAAANKMRGWIYLITNQAMPGHVLVDYCETDPIQQANKLNGPGAPYPYIVAYTALMTDPLCSVELFSKKYSDKKQSGKWYSFAPSKAVAVIRKLCGEQILYEDVKIEVEGVKGLEIPEKPKTSKLENPDTVSQNKVDLPKVENADTCYNLGIKYGKSGQTAQAIEAFQQVVRITILST
jgi:DNA polymerase III epsilon subunit-like protein